MIISPSAGKVMKFAICEFQAIFCFRILPSIIAVTQPFLKGFSKTKYLRILWDEILFQWFFLKLHYDVIEILIFWKKIENIFLNFSRTALLSKQHLPRCRPWSCQAQIENYSWPLALWSVCPGSAALPFSITVSSFHCTVHPIINF